MWLLLVLVLQPTLEFGNEVWTASLEFIQLGRYLAALPKHVVKQGIWGQRKYK